MKIVSLEKKHPRIILSLILILYAASINFSHKNFLNPYWESYSFTFAYTPIDLSQACLILFLVLLASTTMPTKLNTASSIVILILIIVVYIPTIVITIGMSPLQYNKFIETVIVFSLTFCMICKLANRKKLIITHQNNYLPSKGLVNFLVIGWLLMSSILIINYGSMMQFVSLDDIYAQRTASIGGGVLMTYIKSYYGNVFSPTLITLGMIKRRFLYFLFGFTGCLILYMITAQKTVFLMMIVLPIFYATLSSSKSFLQSCSFYVLTTAIIVYASILYYESNLIAFSFSVEFVLRTLAIPGSMLAKYDEFFSNTSYTWWSHVKGISLFVSPPVQFASHSSWPSLGYIVGEFYQDNSSVNENAHLFAGDGIASAGSLGVIVMGVLLSAWLSLLDKTSINWAPKTSILLIFPVANALTNGPFFTEMLSFGGIFWLFAGRFFRTSTEVPSPPPTKSKFIK